MFVYKGASQAQLHKAKGKVTFGKEEGLIAISGTMASWKAFQANRLVYLRLISNECLFDLTIKSYAFWRHGRSPGINGIDNRI